MTAARRQRKSWRGLFFFLALAGLALLVSGGNMASRAATTERVVSDPNSGLAIDGFDPVAYFIDAAPRLGSPEFELSYAGVVWRFRNEGNRASLVAHPEIYGPQFGGYDPVDLSRGVTIAGNPRFFVVTGARLYLFDREDHRDAFAAEPGRFIKDAKARWPELRDNLAQ